MKVHRQTTDTTMEDLASVNTIEEEIHIELHPSRIAKHQQHRPNTPADSPAEY